jgi:trk system potassium uptake protein TrkA
MAEQIGIETVVSPRNIIADVLVRYSRGLQNSMGSKMETLYKIMDGKAEALEFLIEPDCEIINIPLKDITLKKNILIGGIVRARKTIIPTGDDKILAGDTVILVAAGQRINDISDIIK